MYATDNNANYNYQFFKVITFQPRNLHSVHTLHINAAWQQNNLRLLTAFFRRTVLQNSA